MSNDNNILISYDDPLRGYSREGLIKELQRRLAGRVQKAYVYGSFLTQEFSPGSDIDLILIKDTVSNFFERYKEFHDLRTFNPSIEYLVYTPEEWHRLTSEPSIGFWESLVSTMQRIV